MMTNFQLDDLVKPLTVAEVKKSMYDVLTVLGVPTTTWILGSVVRTIVTACAIMIAALSNMIALMVRGGFLSTAQEEWAEINARETYGAERIQGTFATTTLTLTNNGGGLYSPLANEVTFRNSVTNATYRNTAAFTLNPSATLSVPVVAEQIGSLGNAAPGEIDDIVTNTLVDVVCTNPTAAVGVDQESIADLKVRAGQRLGALSPNGAKDAYSYVAKTATRPDGSTVGINRVNALPNGSGGVTVYLATASGAVSGPDVTIVDEAIQTQCVPLGTTCVVESATAVPIPITYTVYCVLTTGLSVSDIQSAISSALATYLSSAPIGGYKVGPDKGIWASKLRSVIGTAVTDKGVSIGCYRVDLSTSDTLLGAGEVATLGTITPTVNQS